MRHVLLLTAVAAGLVCAAPLMAQGRQHDGPAHGQRLQRLAEHLDLTGGQREAIKELITEQRAERRELIKQLMEERGGQDFGPRQNARGQRGPGQPSPRGVQGNRRSPQPNVGSDQIGPQPRQRMAHRMMIRRAMNPEMRQQLRELRQQRRKQIKEILNDEQLAKLKEVRRNMRERVQQRRGQQRGQFSPRSQQRGQFGPQGPRRGAQRPQGLHRGGPQFQGPRFQGRNGQRFDGRRFQGPGR